jgi:hypothetical protein
LVGLSKSKVRYHYTLSNIENESTDKPFDSPPVGLRIIATSFSLESGFLTGSSGSESSAMDDVIGFDRGAFVGILVAGFVGV